MKQPIENICPKFPILHELELHWCLLPIRCVVLSVGQSVHLSRVIFLESAKNRFCDCEFAQVTYFAPVILVFVIYINTIFFFVNFSSATICQYFKSDPARKSWIQPCPRRHSEDSELVFVKNVESKPWGMT